MVKSGITKSGSFEVVELVLPSLISWSGDALFLFNSHVFPIALVPQIVKQVVKDRTEKAKRHKLFDFCLVNISSFLLLCNFGFLSIYDGIHAFARMDCVKYKKVEEAVVNTLKSCTPGISPHAIEPF
jgi:hypothetical protein